MVHPSIIRDKKFTYGEYYSWRDGKRWELIEGILYDITPTPPRYHQDVLQNLSLPIMIFLNEAPGVAYYAPFDVRLPESDEPDDDIRTVVQPDFSVFIDETKLDERGARGAPDIVVEVVSPYTTVKDTTTKFDLYQKHKVKEYWVVYPNEKCVDVFLLDDEGKYSSPKTFVKGDKITTPILEGLEIPINEIFE